MPDSTTELSIRLSYVRVHGDVNGQNAQDAVVILVADPGGSGTFYCLAPVLNQDGVRKPLASQFLGDRVFIRSLQVENRRIVIDLDISGATDSARCPTDHKHFTYAVEGDRLVELEVVDLPDPRVSVRMDDVPQRIELPAGATALEIENDIAFNRINGYVLGARAGQMMTVATASPHDDVWVSVRGNDGTVLAREPQRVVQRLYPGN